MNRQRLLTLAVAANAVLTIVALIRIYTVSNIIQTNLATLSGNLDQLGRDVSTLNEQVRRASSSVSDLTDGSLQAVRTTVTHLNGNLANLDSSVASLQGFTKEQTQDHGALGQSISAFAATLHNTGAEVTSASTADGGVVQTALHAYQHDLAEAGGWTLRQNTDADGGLVRGAIARYASTVDGAGQAVSQATQEYRTDLKAGGENVVKAGEPGGSIAGAQAAYKTALATAGTQASDQVRDQLTRFFQDNQPALIRELMRKVDAKCQCTCDAGAGTTKSAAPSPATSVAAHTP